MPSDSTLTPGRVFPRATPDSENGPGRRWPGPFSCSVGLRSRYGTCSLATGASVASTGGCRAKWQAAIRVDTP